MNPDFLPDPLKAWQDKLTYLQYQEAIATDHAVQYSLMIQIEECKRKIAELERYQKKFPLHDPDFVGREGAITTIDDLGRRSRVILIQGAGGVGKTTLARKYLDDRFGKNVIEFMIAKETDNIAPIEGLLEQCLRSMGEEPGRDFLVSLARLKEKLQARPMGVLIDNLEPALDGTGRFIEPHRRYLELLRVLADKSLQSLTLITSRETLAEGLDISLYRLPSLTLDAWQDYFNSRESGVSSLFEAYRGNALAMKLLRERVSLDYGEDIAAFWQDHHQFGGLLTVENLIKEQFDRLESIYPAAYRLLCRMGCFRYQDVPTVPLEGLFCLLWDVEENQRGRVVRDLLDRSLVDRVDGEYQLHSLIREEAIARLKSSEDWKQANQRSAEFWAGSVQKKIETVNEALQVLESYHNFCAIDDYESAAKILVESEQYEWNKDESLPNSLYRLSLYDKTINICQEILKKLSVSSEALKYTELLADYLGFFYRQAGEIKKAIKQHKKAREIIEEINNNDGIKYIYVGNIGLCFMDAEEYEEAVKYFKEIFSFNTIDTNSEMYFHSKDCSYFCLSFSYSASGRLKKARKILEKIGNLDDIANFRTWGKCHKYLFVALTYQNLGELDRAFELFEKAIAISDRHQYPEVEAKALTGLGKIYRHREEYDEAIKRHEESIEILENIRAKCALAEAYYQFGLTYQAMEETEKSRSQFDKSLKLWTEIDAPIPIEKVRNAMNKDLSAPTIEEWTET